MTWCDHSDCVWLVEASQIQEIGVLVKFEVDVMAANDLGGRRDHSNRLLTDGVAEALSRLGESIRHAADGNPVTRYPLPVIRYPLSVIRYPLSVISFPLTVDR